MSSQSKPDTPVLVVDDDGQLLHTLADILRMRGYRPLTAQNGQSGLEIAEDMAAALAIALIDLRLPDMDGLQLIAQLHALSELTEVVVLTGHASLESALAALREESFDYLVKPVAPDDLLQTMERARERWGRRRAEQELRTSEERFRLLMENIADSVLVTDPAGAVQYVSPSVERQLGYAPGDLVGKPLLELFHPGDVERARSFLDDLGRRPGRTEAMEAQVRHKDGSWRSLEAIGRNLTERVGIGGIVLTARDVSERKRLEAQLFQAQKMESIGRLAGGVAHDFNNLLTAILSYSEMAIGAVDPEEPIHEDLEEIRRAAGRAGDLTRQLLAFSRQQILEPRIIDLNEQIVEMAKLLERVLGEDVELETVTAPDVWPIKADPSQMEQVLMNLAVNARDAMPDGGRLRIETRNERLESGLPERQGEMPAGEFVMLSIADSGCGIPEDVLGKLFEPFFTTKEPGKGTGLGLATVYGIVKQSGGYISVDSESGRGTVFRIYLPRAEEEEPEAPPHRGPEPGAVEGTETILVVEDEPAVRAMSARVLRRCGYTVLAAGTAEEALNVLSAHEGKLDLLFTDTVLPGMNGAELAERVLALVPDIRILFTSGYTHETMVRHGLGEAAVNLLHKPFDPSALARRVRDVLDE